MTGSPRLPGTSIRRSRPPVTPARGPFDRFESLSQKPHPRSRSQLRFREDRQRGRRGQMGYNFRPLERDQQYLMPPSLRNWLPPDDLAWVVLDAVDQIDLGPIHAPYRADGWGAPAYDPAMMTALLLYAYATGERSSRRIEARCRRDIAYRVICANQVPDPIGKAHI